MEIDLGTLADSSLVSIRADDVVVVTFFCPTMRTTASEAFGFTASAVRTGSIPSFVVAILREGAFGDARIR